MTPHHEHQAKEALQRSADEIVRLRREIELLSIKAHAFDTFAGFVSLLGPRGQIMSSSPDAVWIIRKLLAEIDAEAAKTATPVTQEGAADGAR